MSKIQSRCKTGLPLILSFVAFLVISGCTTTIKPSTDLTLESPISCSQQNKAIISYNAVIDAADPGIAKALKEFPKGGDIHNHLSGSIMPEDYIKMGVNGNYCYNTTSFAITTCSSETHHLSEASDADIEKIKQALSMYNYNYPDIQSGHDHFFSTFGNFGAVSGTYQGEMLAKLLKQAYDDNVAYVETMMSFGANEFDTLYNALTKEFPNDSDYENTQNYSKMLAVLKNNGLLSNTVASARIKIDQYEQTAKEELGCETTDPSGACFVMYRFQGEVNRNPKDPLRLSRVFIQAAINFVLATDDERVVGVNLVSGEDSQTSMEDFEYQMNIFTFFNTSYPDVNIAIHAGELTPCFVGEGNFALFKHLTRSLDAGAKRIGHGISFEYLNNDQRQFVVGEIKTKKALVEVPMTSNAQILGVTGDEHPFQLYFRNYDVPVCFATDDEGVSYNNFTNEWIYAWAYYTLSFDELLTLARNSLQYSFLHGEPLWADIPSNKINSQCANDQLGIAPQTDTCNTFLKGSNKAAVQWHHEMKLHDFEAKYGAMFRNQLTQTAN